MKEIKKCFSCLFKNHSHENLNTKLIKENDIPIEICTKKNNIPIEICTKKNYKEPYLQLQTNDWVCFIGNKHPASQIYCDCLYKSLKKEK
tara:strand:+ start:2208 stop:2477 length:270 start_codon:yes stop_codon:yes gene_type:complete